MTLTKIYNETVQSLRNAGVPEAENDSGLLLNHYYGVSRNDLLVHGDREMEENAEFEAAVNERIGRRPLQYIIGKADFMGLEFAVDERVLVPRFDTELLVEEALKDLHGGSRILDLCTGSGCILISLLRYSMDCEGYGVDISEDALAVAGCNAGALLGEDKKYTFLQGDLWEPVEALDDNVFDLIVSNPPYIASEVIEGLMTEVKDFEPRIALDGTEDGLEFYRKIAKKAPKHLSVGGRILLEIGYDQGEEVSKLLTEAGFIEVEVLKDYSGLDRVVCGIKSWRQ